MTQKIEENSHSTSVTISSAFGCCTSVNDSCSGCNCYGGNITSNDGSSIAENSITDGESIETHSNNNNNNNNDSMFNLEKKEFRFPKRMSVNVEFQDIKYTVGSFSFSKRKYERKEILHNISGAFRSGQLTAIMGPSGAGKSTLLNILAGYVETGVAGKILVNGKCRSTNSQTFRNLSAYIHQEDALRPYLTVGEAMNVATNLKLGYNVTKEYKSDLINRILILLGLDKRINTFSGRLSGGQKKRLAIALEMINNPPILFLDEPTTGLDSASCTRCISLLKRLAQEGRTIVCTIHQPSALLFEMFDKLYAVAEGNCIYQGPVKQLVPFMRDLGLPCPSYHNPADFLMELASGEYGNDLKRMMASATKKYYEDCDRDEFVIEREMEIENDSSLPSITYGSKDSNLRGYNNVINYKNENIYQVYNHKTMYCANTQPASILMQFLLLTERNFKVSQRNTFLILARVLAHILIASLFGYLYVNVGSKATTVLANYVYLFGSILLIVYTGKMSVVLSFPLEMEILAREHFNRWYQLGPYYLSVITFEVPFQMFCAWLYIVISYYLTGNNYENNRFYYFTLMCLLATIAAQSWGFFIGATLPVKIAVFVGPVLAVVFSVFGFCTRYIDITPFLSWIWHISYFRAGFHGIINTVYGMNRQQLECPENAMYCHFKNPKVFLQEMLINEHDTDLTANISLLCGVLVTMHILTIIALWLKLNKR